MCQCTASYLPPHCISSIWLEKAFFFFFYWTGHSEHVAEVVRLRENANRMEKGKLINVRSCHPGLFNRLLSSCMLSIFSLSFHSWALDHFGFPSPLHSAQFCHPAKETNQRALSQPPHFSFVSLCLSLPLSTCSSVCTLLSQHTLLWPTPFMMSHREQGLLGSDPGLHELVSSEHFCHCKMAILSFQESASLVWRKCLLFQELCPALLKSLKVAPWFPIFL